MDTTATVRKESIEDQKAQLDARISDIRQYRDTFPYDCDSWKRYDAEIDTLLAKKDALTACPSGWLEGDPDLGTHVIISGGEVMELSFPEHMVEENDVSYGLSFRETEF